MGLIRQNVGVSLRLWVLWRYQAAYSGYRTALTHEFQPLEPEHSGCLRPIRLLVTISSLCVCVLQFYELGFVHVGGSGVLLGAYRAWYLLRHIATPLGIRSTAGRWVPDNHSNILPTSVGRSPQATLVVSRIRIGLYLGLLLFIR